MRKVKRIVFWICFVPMVILMIVGGVLFMAGEFLAETLPQWFEGWCMEYKKHGWVRVHKGGLHRYHPELDQYRNEKK